HHPQFGRGPRGNHGPNTGWGPGTYWNVRNDAVAAHAAAPYFVCAHQAAEPGTANSAETLTEPSAALLTRPTSGVAARPFVPAFSAALCAVAMFSTAASWVGSVIVPAPV